MSRILILLLCFFCTFSFGQSNDRFFLIMQLTPEITNHLNAYHGKDNYTTTTFNCGTQMLLQYALNKRTFIQGGVGYIPRKINTSVIFDQSAIPPPRQSLTEELVHASQVTYRTVQFPLLIGYTLSDTSKCKWYIDVGVIGNYATEAHYVTSFKKYAGTYDKNYWQGYTLQVGTGIDFKISNSIFTTISAAVSLVNTVKEDPFLYGQGNNGVVLTHTYQNLSIGVKIPLDN